MSEYSYEIVENVNLFKNEISKHPFQCGGFGKFYSKQHGCDCNKINVYCEDLLVATLIYFVKGPGSETLSGFPGGKWINAMTQFALPEIVWYGGPVFVGKVNEEEVVSYIIHVLGKRYGTKKLTADLSCLYGFNKWASYRVNLLKSEDELWNGLDKSVRKNILKTSEKVDVRVVNDKYSVSKYLRLLKNSRKHLGFIYLPPVHVNDCLVACCNGRAKVVLVTEKSSGKAIAGMGLLMGGEGCVEVGSAISNYCRVAKLYCGDLIKWEIVKFAKLNGLKWYDLGGCSPDPVNDKEESIKRFKKKFGGDYVEYGVLR